MLDTPHPYAFATRHHPVPRRKMLLLPNEDKFRECIVDLLAEGVDVVTAHDSILTHPDMAAYTSAALEGKSDDSPPLDLAEVVLASPKFLSSRDSIINMLTQGFDATSSFCAIFEPFSEIYLANEAAAVNIVS